MPTSSAPPGRVSRGAFNPVIRLEPGGHTCTESRTRTARTMPTAGQCDSDYCRPTRRSEDGHWAGAAERRPGQGGGQDVQRRNHRGASPPPGRGAGSPPERRPRGWQPAAAARGVVAGAVTLSRRPGLGAGLSAAGTLSSRWRGTVDSLPERVRTAAVSAPTLPLGTSGKTTRWASQDIPGYPGTDFVDWDNPG